MLFVLAQTADATDTSVRYPGVNIAGGDFAAENLPGTYGRDYIYPDPNTIAYFAAKGISIIRWDAAGERWMPLLDWLPHSMQNLVAGRKRH